MTDHWDLPFRGDDFLEDERVWWPADDGGGSYNLRGHLFDPVSRTWSEYAGNTPANMDFHLYGKPVYAMQDGEVIAGWRNAPENPTPMAGGQEAVPHEEITRHDGGTRISGLGNGLWVRHADGTRVEYAHFRPGTVPRDLCPHEEPLLPYVVESLAASDAWPHISVPEGKRAVVRKGQKLGEVGNSGANPRPALRVHREHEGGMGVAISFSRGLHADATAEGWHTTWTPMVGRSLPERPCVIWPPEAVAEHAGVGTPLADFLVLSEHLADSGLWPERVRFSCAASGVRVDHFWRPAAAPWRGYWNVERDAFHDIVEQNRAEAFRPEFIERIGDGEASTYAAVFVAGTGGR